MLVVTGGSAQAAATPGRLGPIDSFAVLAGAGTTSTGPTLLTGDLGTFKTTSVSGSANLAVLGVDHGGDAVTQQAKRGLQTGSTPTTSTRTPRIAATAGWSTGAPTPGALGPAVRAGHVDGAGRPGVFAELVRTAGDPSCRTPAAGSVAGGGR